jgi:hypothetical protein
MIEICSFLHRIVQRYGRSHEGTQALPLDKQCLERGTEINNYSQGQGFSSLAGTFCAKNGSALPSPFAFVDLLFISLN